MAVPLRDLNTEYDDEEIIDVEVVYMVGHDNELSLLRVYQWQYGLGSTSCRNVDSLENEEDEEFK